jgi:predicted  nucleic acid-binding Zn-ribbon protein
MPPVGSQGSRGGLVAAVVVFTVLFVASTIFAIYFGVQDSKAEESLQSLTSTYREIAHDVNGPDVIALRQLARSDSRLEEQTALAEAIQQRKDLSEQVLGHAAAQLADVGATISQMEDTIQKVNKLLVASGAKLTSSSLMSAIANLTTEVGTLQDAVKTADAAREQALQQANDDSAAARDASAKAAASVASAQEELQKRIDADNDDIKKTQGEVASVRKTFEDEQAVSTTKLDADDKQRADLINQLDSLKKQMDRLRDKLAGRRVEVEDAIVRRPEGEVVQIVDAKTLYINLGQGDQIVPGMTFEVYDKSQPLPKLGDGLDDENLPKGKASLEVTRVLANGSECHIVNVEPGQTIVQGDRLLNLIYDRNVKFKFFVYGDFDIARTGHPTPAGADIIRRLISQWGGEVVDKLDENTDFVIVGTPPEVPIYSAEDLKDPLNEQNLDNAKLAADNYDKIVNRAVDLHTAIMNQNKFLYFIGFYDLALR